MKNLKLVTKKQKQHTLIQVGNQTIGLDFVVIAGPCSVESEKQMLIIAEKVKKAGADMLRGGAFKPRTSPYSFQGLGLEGLRILHDTGILTGLPVVTEVMDTRDVAVVSEYADILQIGARNMQNFSLLKEVGRQKKPVLLKRGLTATIAEFLNCAEYILYEGNPQVILCERGIRTFETYTRNTLDLAAVAALKELTHLPVIVDPTHSTGLTQLVKPMSVASAAAGADGIIVEVHHKPEEALCDKGQALTVDQFESLNGDVRKISGFMKKQKEKVFEYA
jgi:3-deoxy-7-phosphoheptulonate synthase